MVEDLVAGTAGGTHAFQRLRDESAQRDLAALLEGDAMAVEDILASTAGGTRAFRRDAGQGRAPGA